MTPNTDSPSIIINELQDQDDDVPLDLHQFAIRLSQYLQLSINYIEITLLPKHHIQSLNNDYFSVNTPTDTISFNLTPNEAITGDIYLCPAVIKANAIQFNTSYASEFKIVLIHSFLHLMGERDGTDDEFKHMQNRQLHILKELES
ncbi:MAG: rRNA maturation RNase YbeY [Candidatus Marinamargulisbacteria bacterium]